METMLQILTDYGIEIITSAGVVIAVLLGKTKTAEQLEKQRQKVLEKKKMNFQKLITKAKQKQQEIEKLEEEVKK